MEQSDIFYNIYSRYQDRDPEKRRETPEFYKLLPDPCGQYQNAPILFYAASYADSPAVAYLLEAGADPGQRTEGGRTALHALAYGQSAHIPAGAVLETAKLLLNAGTSPLRKNEDNRTCAFIAAEKGTPELIRALAELGKKMDQVGPHGQTPLHAACEYANHAAESFFKYTKPKYDEALARPEPEDDFGKRMHKDRLESNRQQHDRDKARVDAYLETVRLLMEAGLDPDQKDDSGKSPKEIAFSCKDLRVPALLAGQDPQAGGLRTKGMQAMQAVQKGDHDALAAILEQGEDPNGIWDGPEYERGVPLAGKGPLALACAMLDAKSIALLLAHGADPNLKDTQECTPLSWAFSTAARVNSNTFRNRVIEGIFADMAKAGLKVDLPADRNGNTLLHMACDGLDRAHGYNNNTMEGSFLEQLLRLGANPNAANLDGVTPLMHLCAGRDKRMEDALISLLERDAEVFARDKNGDTPLIYLCKNGKGALAKTMAELLFDFGDPKPGTANNEGKTALDYAVERDNELLVRYLLEKS